MNGYIVEGKNDKLKLNTVLTNVYIVVLEGIKFGIEQRENINKALKVCKNVYLLTDPDEAGDYAAKRIQEVYPEIKRIKVDPDKAKIWKKRGYKYGVEYCSKKYLMEILTNK